MLYRPIFHYIGMRFIGLLILGECGIYVELRRLPCIVIYIIYDTCPKMSYISLYWHAIYRSVDTWGM